MVIATLPELPPAFHRAVLKRLGIEAFVLDIAATPDNALAPKYYTKENSAFAHSWIVPSPGWAWLNPPYDRNHFEPWAKKACCTSSNIAALLPAHVGAAWWGHWVHGHANVLFLGSPLRSPVVVHWCYPRDLALVLYTPEQTGVYQRWDWKRE